MADKETGRLSRYWKYSWLIFWNLVRLAVVWLLFSKFTAAFETVVIGILVLIYSTSNFSFRSLERNLAAEAQVQRGLMFRILEKVGNEDLQEAKEELTEQAKELRGTNVSWVINIFAGVLIDLYVAWKIIAVIFA